MNVPRGKVSSVPGAALCRAAVAFVAVAWCASLAAAPWIQQDRWLFLGPLANPSGCGGGDLTANPVPGHDLKSECPGAGADWSDVTGFVTNARTSWTLLSTLAGAGDVVDLEAISKGLGVPQNGSGDVVDVKAMAAIYAVNTTGSAIPVGICTGSDDSIVVVVNDTVVTSVSACRGTSGDCSEVNPAVLVPGKNKIVAIVYEGGGGWGFRLKIIKPDGTAVDDASDPDVLITADAAGCAALSPYRTSRSIEMAGCPLVQATVRVAGTGEGDPQATMTITETVQGQAEIGQVSHGGTVTPATTGDPVCRADPLEPVGVLDDHLDIGSPAGAGTTVMNTEGLYEVTGGGDDIWSGGDQFQFAYKKLRGDFTITARIAARNFPSPTDPSDWGKFGLMARQDCTARSRYAFVTDVAGHPLEFQGRRTHGGSDNFGAAGGAAGEHPDHLRLERTGNTFAAYASTDGVAWTFVHAMDWGPAAPATVFAGLAVTSHAGSRTINIHFDQVEVLGGDEPAPPPVPAGGTIVWNVPRSDVTAGLSYQVTALGPVAFSGNDGEHLIAGAGSGAFNSPGTGAVGPDFENSLDVGGSEDGSTTFDAGSGVYTQRSSGRDIWDGGDQFQYAYKQVTGDFELVVEVLSRQDPPVPNSSYGKHGLMARRDCSGNSRYSHLQTMTGQVKQWPRWTFRNVHATNGTNDDGQQYNYGPDQAPRFMKLIRFGNTFHGFFSIDGVEWRPVGSNTWQDQDLADPVYVGFASTSHESSQGYASVITFKVVRFQALEALPLLPEESLADPLVFQDDFTSLNPLDWSVQKRDASFVPLAQDGRLRLLDQAVGSSSTSAFNLTPLEDIDSAVYQWEFDVFMARDAGQSPADGLTFAVLGGGLSAKDYTRVGFNGGAMAVHGLGRDTDGASRDFNISTNGFTVEFDVWTGGGNNEGTGSPDNPRTYHLGINSGHNVHSVAMTSTGLPDLFDTGGVHARVRYNRGKVQVWLTSNAAGGGEDPVAPTLEARVLPISFSAPEGSAEMAVYGFTGATGGATVTGEVDDLLVRRLESNPANWVRCNANGDALRDISDPVFLLSNLFTGGAAPGCLPACDCNGDGGVDISDPIYDLSFLFSGGPPPAAPYPACDRFEGCSSTCQ